MKKIISVTAMVGVFIILLFANINVINGKMIKSDLQKLSLKSIVQTAEASTLPACVYVNFSIDAVQSSDIILCFNSCNELCGIECCCISQPGGGNCQETICQGA